MSSRTGYDPYDGRCHECGSSDLHQDPTTDRIICGRCKRSYSLPEFEEWDEG